MAFVLMDQYPLYDGSQSFDLWLKGLQEQKKQELAPTGSPRTRQSHTFALQHLAPEVLACVESLEKHLNFKVSGHWK